VPVIAGDSVLFLGTRAERDGQPVIDVVSVLIRGAATPHAPVPLTAAEAVSAAGGARDAALVVIRSATIADTATVTGGRLLTLDDDSGSLAVLLSSTINFNPLNTYLPGVRLDATGLLVPDTANPGTWRLKPRNRADLLVLPPILP
jgi:hypothetical protein